MRLLAAALVLGMLAGTAQAVTLTGTIETRIFDNGQDEGLRVGITPITQAFDANLLALGDSVSFDLFDIAVIERTGTALDPDDTTARGVAVTFDFGRVQATVQGTRRAVTGVVFPGQVKARNAGFITFDPLELAVGTNQIVTIALSDAYFSGDFTGLGRFAGDGLFTGPVRASLTLTAVPVPGAMGLMLTALGALVLAGRRYAAAP